MWQRNCYKCLFVLAYFKHQLRICPVWIPGKESGISWFLRKKGHLFSAWDFFTYCHLQINDRRNSVIKKYISSESYVGTDGVFEASFPLLVFPKCRLAGRHGACLTRSFSFHCCFSGSTFSFPGQDLQSPLQLSHHGRVLMVPSCSGLFCAFQDD